MALKHNGPVALILSRQVLPNIDNSNYMNVSNGAYIVYEGSIEKNPDIIIVATGSEVSLAIDVAKSISEQLLVRVVSMPCCELYDLQSDQYKESILPKNIKKISLEAGCTVRRHKYVDHVYGIDRFGESAKINDIKEYFGFTVNKINKYIIKIIE